jgi:signal transduction histidine kinase
VSATCRHLISQNGNTFALDKQDGLGLIQTDETRLRQILINLLGNAGKFTRDGKVVLHARRLDEGDREQVLISVKDTGIGMSPETIPNLFKEFSQLEPVAFKGTGLGLAVSQRLARLLDGDISVRSRPGRGSEFTLRLPTAARADAVAA